MEPYAGFEPQVGEIRAVRTFRVGPGGVLYPLFSAEPWRDGPNTAQCRFAEHAAPDPDCSCGFYAYADEASAGEYAQARYVLAVVSCWGRVVAGSRGVRAEHARIDGLWVSPAVPAQLAASVRSRYRTAGFYDDRAALLHACLPTRLDGYDDSDPGRVNRARWWRALLVAVAVAAGALPASWIGDVPAGRALLAVAVAGLLARAFVFGRRPAADLASRRRSLLYLALSAWLITPLAGAAGVLLRLPLVQVSSLGLLQRRALLREARRFPARIG